MYTDLENQDTLVSLTFTVPSYPVIPNWTHQQCHDLITIKHKHHTFLCDCDEGASLEAEVGLSERSDPSGRVQH